MQANLVFFPDFTDPVGERMLRATNHIAPQRLEFAQPRAELDAALSRSITERVAPIVRVASEAAASDPELAAILDDKASGATVQMTFDSANAVTGWTGPGTAATAVLARPRSAAVSVH